MPIIEFRCRACHVKFEELILKADAPLKAVCPRCGAVDIERLFSVFGFVSRGASDRLSAGRSSSGCSSCARSSCAGCGN